MSDQENNDINNEENQDKKFLVSNIPPGIAIFLGVSGVFILYQIVGGMIMISIFGTDMSAVDMNAFRLYQIASQFLFIFIPAVFLSRLFFNDVTTVMRINKVSLTEVGLYSIGIILVTVLAMDLQAIQDILFRKAIGYLPFLQNVKDFLDNMNEMLDESYTQILTSNNVIDFILVVLTVSITPAICEEFFFRGFVQRGFEFSNKPIWAALFTAIIFSFYHLNAYGFLALVGIGFYLGYSVYMSNSIFIPVILHFINNFVAVLLFTFFQDEDFVSSTGAFQAGWIHILRFAFLLAIFISLLMAIKRFYEKQNTNKQEVL